MKRRIAGLVVLLLALLLPDAGMAQGRAIHWERYDIAVDVRPDGNLRFTETQRLVVDQGEFRFGARSFETGQRGQVRDVSVSESGQAFRPGQDVPGTYTGADDGEQFRLTYYFLDPTARTHDITVSYTVARSLIPAGEQVRLEWPFYCAAQCPRIDSGTVTIRLPGDGTTAAIDAAAAGVEARQTAEGATTRWELAQPIQNEQLLVTMAFPSGLLSPGAQLRTANRGPAERAPVEGQPAPRTIPNPNGVPNPNVVPAAPGFSGTFCVIVLFMLFFAFSMMRGSARRRVHRDPRPTFGGPFRRGGFGGPLGRGGLGGPFGGGMFGGGPFGVPGRRRFRGRGFGGWGGGWGVPPIIIPPPFPPQDNSGGPFNPPQDMSPGGNNPQDESFGSGGTWDDSFGSGGGWGGSGGSGGGWGGSGGSGGSWGDSGGGSSWGGGGGGDSGGGGNNDSSSFG